MRLFDFDWYSRVRIDRTGQVVGVSRKSRVVRIDDTDSPYTPTRDTEIIICDCTNGDITVNLPEQTGVAEGDDISGYGEGREGDGWHLPHSRKGRCQRRIGHTVV